MATKFVKPETIPLFIKQIDSQSLTSDQVIEAISSFRTKDKIIKHQLLQITTNLEWNRENDIYSAMIISATPKKPNSTKKQKK
jgi:hypothetical protein